MPKSKCKRESIGLSDLIVGLATGNGDMVKKITRKGSQNRLTLMTIASMSKVSTPEQKAVAHKEIKYALMNQAGRVIKKKTDETFGVA